MKKRLIAFAAGAAVVAAAAVPVGSAFAQPGPSRKCLLLNRQLTLAEDQLVNAIDLHESLGAIKALEVRVGQAEAALITARCD